MIHSLGWGGLIFIDTVGHCAGLVLFGLLIVLLLRNRRSSNALENRLSLLAAVLVFLWNLAELSFLAHGPNTGAVHPAADISFCCLSLLPAVFLHISLEHRLRVLTFAGYALSASSIALQYGEGGVLRNERSRLSLLILSVGFILLALAAWLWAEWKASHESAGWHPKRVVFVSLAIFASSFLHFQSGHTAGVWMGEAIWHHAVIPLALLILVQDYRFLLLDAFVRFAVSAFWIAACLAAAYFLSVRYQLPQAASQSDFARGLLLTAAGLAVFLLAQSIRYWQIALTRFAFRRPAWAALRCSLLNNAAQSSEALLEHAASTLAAYYQCYRAQAVWETSCENERELGPHPVDRTRHAPDAQLAWAMIAVPIRFSRGDCCTLFLGARAGGRRFLSEDLQTLERAQATLLENVERLRSAEISRSASQAELRALHAQINPHFLFNALNTLYGTIGRESADARRLVLNLAELFRARLQTARTHAPLSEELDIVRAYLEIEALRLGSRLSTGIAVDEGLASIIIPVLTIQPLVENAVKHGMSPAGDVDLQLTVKRAGPGLVVTVADRGPGFQAGEAHRTGSGVGLSNVRKRLSFCYGAVAELRVDSSQAGSIVSFAIPLGTG